MGERLNGYVVTRAQKPIVTSHTNASKQPQTKWVPSAIYEAPRSLTCADTWVHGSLWSPSLQGPPHSRRPCVEPQNVRFEEP